MANQPQQPDTALHNASHLMQYHDLIESIVAALDARDAYTASHSDRVADMVLVLAAALGLDEDETTRIHMAAHLHDIGKIAVPDSVLRKAGPLTRPEWEEMRRHPVTGYEILRKIDDFKEIAILVRHHHERWDGRGYPDGLSGHDIPPGSRVIAVADSIDAMMSSRSYRPAMTSAACRREIEKNSGILYDPRVAAAALEHWDELVSRYAGADTPRTPYFDRLQLEHTRQAHDYLLTHQGSRITLPELAAKFHLSQSSLKICFKALYGVPVASYLRGLRMDTAARLLQELRAPGTPNSPHGTHYMARVSPDFLARAGTQAHDQLMTLLPFRSLAITGMKELPGTYVTILASEDRSKELRQRRPSVRRQLKQEPRPAEKPEKKSPIYKKKEPER